MAVSPAPLPDNDFMYQLMVQGDLRQDSKCDETMSVTSVATSFDTFMMDSLKRGEKGAKMNLSTILQNEAVRPTSEFLEATLPEEDELVCLDTIPGSAWLTPLPPSSSFETPPELTFESISIPTPAVSPESVAVPTAFARATPDAPLLNSQGCVPGKADIPPLQSEGCVPEDPADGDAGSMPESSVDFEGLDPDDVAIPPGLSASPDAPLALAGLAMVRSTENQMPKATRQIKYGLRTFKDPNTKWC